MKETGKRVCETPKGRFLWVGVMAAIFAVTVVSNLFFAPFAAAQEERPKQERAGNEYELGTMTVTAQKQEENVQEVPVSITVFSGQDIEDKQIEV